MGTVGTEGTVGTVKPGGTVGTVDSKHSEQDLHRVFKAMLPEIRGLIIQGTMKPTVRPVTDAVTAFIRNKGNTLNVKAGTIGKPVRQQIAQVILEKLEVEGVVVRNKEGGVGKPKYVLAKKHQINTQEAA